MVFNYNLGAKNLTMVKLAITQWLALSILAMIAHVIGGNHYAISLLLGGVSYALPTLVSILLLELVKPYPALAGSLFIGAESLKVLLALIFLISSFFIYPNIHFLSFFMGLLVVSHLIFLLFLKVCHDGSK